MIVFVFAAPVKKTSCGELFHNILFIKTGSAELKQKTPPPLFAVLPVIVTFSKFGLEKLLQENPPLLLEAELFAMITFSKLGSEPVQ